MSNGRFPANNGSGSVFNNNNNNNGNGNTRQHLYPGAFRNYPWPRTNTYLDQKPLVPGIGRGEPEAPALSLGERVVWLRDSGPEIGTARWIGRLPLVSPDWSVGVEFDRPIGTSDGKFGTKQYFTTRPNHAFFLPVMALMKAEEYNGETNFGSSTHREKDTTHNFQTPPRNKATWEKSRANEDNHLRVLHENHHQHCCNYHDHACDASPTTTTTPCYHEAAGANGTRCFVTSTPRNATRHKSVTIKETVGNVPGFGEWSDEDDLSKFPFKSWKSSSRQSVVSCPASVGPPTILIAKELTSDSSDDDRNNGKFKTLMACFLPGVGHRDKKKKKKHRKYILASEKNKISFVSGPESSRQPNTLGAVSAGGDVWRNPPRCDVRSIAGSCGSFPTNHQCVSCGQNPREVVLPPPRKNFSCSGLEKLNSTCHGSANTRDFLSATPITPMKKKTAAPAPPTTLHHRPVSPKFPDKNVIKPEIKGTNSTTSLNSTTSTRSHRLPVIRSLDDARNEIDISLIATKYTFVGNSARSNSFSGTNSQTPETTLRVKELKQLNNPVTISPHPRRTPKKKAPQPPLEDKTPNSEELKKEGSPKKRLAPQPPALPKKTLSHDTMTLFGYTPREGLSRTSSGATLEINLDKSIQSEGSVSDLSSMVAEAERAEEAKKPEVHGEISSLEVNLATSSKFKKTDEDTKSAKILNIAGPSTKKEVVTQTEAKPVVAEAKLKKEEGKKDRAKPKTEDDKVTKKESTSKVTVETTKPIMKTSSSQTNLAIDDNSKSSKKSKRKLLGGSKKNLKKSEENKDEVTEILTEIEQVVKSKPTVQDFVAAFTKFTEKAEQIASTSTSQPATKPEPKPVKITAPKPKIVPIPVAVAPILNKEDKKSLKSFPTKWTFNFKSKEAKEAKKAEDAKKAEEKANLTRNESSPCLESRSEVVRTITPQSSVPLSRKTYNDFKEPEIQIDRYENASRNDRDTQNNVGNNNSAPFIQNREALRRLSKENRNRHGSTLSLGRFVNQQSDIASSAYNNRMCLTPNASPIMSRNRATTAVCAGKPPLPVKLVHDTMAEQNSKSANLFSQLEAAIANGQHQKAAVLARELALQKVTGSLTRFKNKDKANEDKQTTVSLYVEDKDNHQGPIPLSIHPKMTVAMLKQKVEEELHFAVKTQRWILGKTFVVNDESTLGNLDVCTPGCPIFLYIVAPDKEKVKRDQADAYDNDQKNIAINKNCGIESFEALTEIVNRMTAATRNMLLAEELQKSLAAANSHEALETLQEEVDPQPTVKEKVLEASDSLTSTETSEESEPVNDDVESDVTDDEIIEAEEEREDESDDNNEVFEDAKQLNYQELMQLEDQDLIQNAEVFECPICFLEIEIGEGTVLRDCLHNFCKECLAQAVEYSEDAVIKCPFRNNEYSCDSHLLEREIKALVNEEMFEKHLQRSMVAAESKAANSFHCKSPDCPGWCLYEDNVNVFQCPVCALENCLTCQAIHEGKDCKQYQDEIEYDAAASEDAKKTKEYLDNMVKEGQAMHCPTCRVIVMKKWGCDWLKCSVCQTEICWVTKGPRWGPGGRGDTSAGCKCGVNGVRCHTLCNYCH